MHGGLSWTVHESLNGHLSFESFEEYTGDLQSNRTWSCLKTGQTPFLGFAGGAVHVIYGWSEKLCLYKTHNVSAIQKLIYTFYGKKKKRIWIFVITFNKVKDLLLLVKYIFKCWLTAEELVDLLQPCKNAEQQRTWSQFIMCWVCSVFVSLTSTVTILNFKPLL